MATLCMLAMVPLGGLLSDRIGRVRTLRAFFALSLLTFPALLALNGSFGPQLRAQLLASVLSVVWTGGANALYPEILPPQARAVGVAAGFGIGVAIFGGFAPIVSSGIVGSFGFAGMAWFIVGVAALSAIATIRLEETAHAPLLTDAIDQGQEELAHQLGIQPDGRCWHRDGPAANGARKDLIDHGAHNRTE